MDERRAGVPSWVDVDRPASVPPGDPHGTAEEWPAVGAVGRSTRAQAALSRIAAYGLWGGLAMALVLGVVNCAGAPDPRLPIVTSTATPEPVPPPGGCAELVVAAWLSGNPDLLSGLAVAPRSVPVADRRRAVHTYTAAVTPGGVAAGGVTTGGVAAAPASWGYLVGAEVEQRDADDQWQPAGLQFFQVTLTPASAGCQGWSPAAPPARVPAPQLAGAAAHPYTAALATSGTALSDTLSAFFAAMLTGTGSLERYLAPGVSVQVLEEPRYSAVRLAEVRARGDSPAAGTEVPADGTVADLLVTVLADPDTEPLPLVYPVTAGVRGGRWEVISIDPVVGTPGSGTHPSGSPDPTRPPTSTP